MKSCQDVSYPFDCARIYEIHVLGTLDPGMSTYLDGLQSAQIRHSNEGITVTILTGWLPDQAALNGVLNTLYDYGYTLIWVRRTEYGLPSEPG